MSFVDRYLDGSVPEEGIGRFVEAWHEGRGGADMGLHQYLGMSWEEYQLWSANPSHLPLILASRRDGTSLIRQ